MRILEFNEKVLDAWGKYPVAVKRSEPSRCCRKTMILVQSQSGGFIRWFCLGCGNHDTIGLQELRELDLWVRCPNCGQRMIATELPDKNYGFACEHCDIGIRVADLLPWWEDVQADQDR